MGDNNIESYCRVVSCWVESSVVACGWIGVPTSVVSEGASGATVSTGATSALPTIHCRTRHS